MNILKTIKKVILWVLGIVFFAFALFVTILLLNYNKYGLTEFGKDTLVIINDDIASEEYKKGDLVVVTKKKFKDIKVGDLLFTYNLDGKGNATVGLGNVGEIYEDEKSLAYENGSSYSEEYIMGEGTKIYNGIGTYLSLIESRWGFLFLILVPGFLIFVYEVYALIVEIKYGEEQ